MRRRSPKNSRPHEDMALRCRYRDNNPACELSKWFNRNYRNGFTDAELRDESAEVNHIFSMGSRPDLWSNLITLSATIHRWFHKFPIEGRIVCLHKKMTKGELCLDEFRVASGMRLEGWLLAKHAVPNDNPWMMPLWRELLTYSEGCE